MRQTEGQRERDRDRVRQTDRRGHRETDRQTETERGRKHNYITLVMKSPELQNNDRSFSLS